MPGQHNVQHIPASNNCGQGKCWDGDGGERVAWRNEAQALLCALHVDLAIMFPIKFYLEALAKVLIGMPAEIYIR